MLRETLIAEGILEEQIEVVPDEQDAVDRALRIADEGDLLIIFGDNIKRTWKQITKFSPDEHATEAVEVPVEMERPSQPENGGFKLGKNVQLITDERGVRIARSEEEGDD